MDQPVKIGIIGCMGRMGQAIKDSVLAAENMSLVAGSEMAQHPAMGQKIPDTEVMVSDDPALVFSAADVVIDFTPPGATAKHAAFAADHQTAYVVGTTGLSQEDHKALDTAAENTAVLQAGNFSLGVNLLTALTKQVSATLGEDWDIEILEMHHRHKVDAPSGTAMMLGEAAAEGRGVDLEDKSTRVRDGITGEREAGTIGFATLRGGSVIGEHEVIFASESERFTLSHKAENRGLFAKGAVRGARWLADKPKGRYSMLDVLGF